MTLGDNEKNGVIIRSDKGFNYYNSQNDTGLKPVLRERDEATVRTMKVFDTVEIANNQFSIKVHPDGRIEISPNEIG